MNYKDKIEEIIQKQKGTILSTDFDNNNIPRVYLQEMLKNGSLERVSRGIYVVNDSIEDELYALQKKYKNIIYSHETALFLHGMSDRSPLKNSITVYSSYKVTENLSLKFKIYYVKKEFHNLGVQIIESPHGNPIRIYNVERTLCDVLRSRNKIDIQLLGQALKEYSVRKSTDYSILLEYARKLRVERILRIYLEVLI